MFILFKIRNSFPLLKIKSIKKIEQMIVYSNVYFNIIHTILLIIINGELVLYLYIWGQFAKVIWRYIFLHSKQNLADFGSLQDARNLCNNKSSTKFK